MYSAFSLMNIYSIYFSVNKFNEHIIQKYIGHSIVSIWIMLNGPFITHSKYFLLLNINLFIIILTSFSILESFLNELKK